VGESLDSAEYDMQQIQADRPNDTQAVDVANRDRHLGNDEVDLDVDALREGMRGIWRLWKARRRRRPSLLPSSEHEDPEDVQIFLDVVREVLGDS